MENTNLSIKEIKKYLESKGIDSSWIEKSTYIKEYTEYTIPTRIAFYYNEETDELTSRSKDIRGASTDAMSFVYSFFEHGNVIIMEELGRKAVGFDEDTYYFTKQTIYFDKLDGTILAREKRYREYPIETATSETAYSINTYDENHLFDKSFEKTLYARSCEYPSDERYKLHIQYEIDTDKSYKKIAEAPSNYSILHSFIQSVQYENEINRLKLMKKELEEFKGFIKSIKNNKIVNLAIGDEIDRILNKTL